jgi:proteasome lid subunit RPN8/RPN11
MSELVSLTLPQAILDGMIEHARSAVPGECVGMLAGSKDGTVHARWPLVNTSKDPRRFESEPRSQLETDRRRREQNLELLAFYHSHPTSPAVPSTIDTDPEVSLWVGTPVLCVIVSLQLPIPMVRVYSLYPHRYEERQLVVVEHSR